MAAMTKIRETRKLKYSRIYEELLHAINNGEYKTFESIPAEEELCRMYSVSRPTAATAVNMLVENNMLRRIKGKGTFVIPMKAAPTEKAFIGVVVPTGASYNHTQVIVDNIVMQKELRNFKPVVSRPYSSENMCEILKHLSSEIKHFLVYPYQSSPDFSNFIKEMRERNLRIILMNFSLPDLETDYVIPDFEKAAYLATEYLIAKGRKKIAYMTQSKLEASFQLPAVNKHFSGYKKALSDHGINFDESLVTEELPQSSYPPEFFSYNMYISYLAARVLFRNKKGVSGLVTFNDMNALGAITALEELGIKVPGDVSVVGFGDDSELHAYFTNTCARCNLTTVSAHREIIALRATEMICRMVTEEKTGGLQQIRVEPTLIVRET